MSQALRDRIQDLSDRQASHVATCLAGDIFQAWDQPPAFAALARWADDQAQSADIPLNLARNAQWNEISLAAGDSGELVREILSAWADDPSLAPVLEKAIEQYGMDRTADLGVLSLPVAIGLTYVFLAVDIDINLGFVKLKRKGLTAEQQAAIINKTMQKLASLLTIPKPGGN